MNERFTLQGLLKTLWWACALGALLAAFWLLASDAPGHWVFAGLAAAALGNPWVATQAYARASGRRQKTAEAHVDRLKAMGELMLADDVISPEEAEALLAFLHTHPELKRDPATRELAIAVTQALADHRLDADEAAELRTVLSEFCDLGLVCGESGTRRGPSPALAKAGDAPRPGELFAISYTDANGDSADREVIFRGVSRSGGHLYLNGLCKAQQAYRTFRIDRISLAVRTATGEWIGDPAAFFAQA